MDGPSSIIPGIHESYQTNAIGKAPGPDNNLLELFPHGGYGLSNKLFYRMWDTKTVPDDFENANIISIFNKRDRSVCKVVARIFLGRLLDVAEEVISESAVFVGDMATPGKKPMNSDIHSSPSFGTFAKPSTRFLRLAMWSILDRSGYPITSPTSSSHSMTAWQDVSVRRMHSPNQFISPEA